MKELPHTTDKPSRFQSLLLVVICSITFLRATYIEAFNAEQGAASKDSQAVTLVLSSILLGCFVFWFAGQLVGKALSWRKTWFAATTLFFVAGGIAALTQSSDKRAAITNLVTLSVPIFTGLLLVQLLCRRADIRLILFIVIAIGAAAAVTCADQYFSSNEALIADYENNPSSHLERLGIEPGSLEQWMYEHRLYSKGVRGFLMTANSTASFLILAVFVGIGICADCLNSLKQISDKKQKEQALAAGICYAFTTVLMIAGLLLTQSRGGIGSFAIGLILFAFLTLAGKYIWKRRWFFGIAAALFITAAAIFIAAYGTRHGRLPGGNAMFVRWQYWTSTANMIADHPIGVGGANFPVYYPAYKIAAASETVQDPHNWILSLLSQYGPMGLLAFVTAVFWPFYKALKYQFDPADTLNKEPFSDNKLRLVLPLAITLLLLVVRPYVESTDFASAENTKSAVYGYIVLYLVPAVVFAGVFLLLQKASEGDRSAGGRPYYLNLAIICGLASVLIHNLIDFAIFEPGIWGCFWLILAALIANMNNEKHQQQRTFVLRPALKAAAAIGIISISALYLYYAVVMPLLSNQMFKSALNSQTAKFEILEQAISADRLSSQLPYDAAGLIAQIAKQSGQADRKLLQTALKYSQIAHTRNPAEFKILRLQADIYEQLSKLAENPEKTQLLKNALMACQKAIERYPGSDRLHFRAAQIAESLGMTQKAIEHYKVAVQIENEFRQQFKLMYPDRKEVISRLGTANYKTAQEKVIELQQLSE